MPKILILTPEFILNLIQQFNENGIPIPSTRTRLLIKVVGTGLMFSFLTFRSFRSKKDS